MVLIGVLVSVPAALLLQEHHEHDHEDQFERQADVIASNAQDGSMRVLARVDDIADLLSIRGVPNQAEFQRYLRQAGIDADHHLTDLAFIASVDGAEVDRWLAEESALIGRRIRLRPERDNPARLAVLARTAKEREGAVGIDLLGLPGGEDTLQTVIETGEALYYQPPEIAIGLYDAFSGGPGTQLGSSSFTGIMLVGQNGRNAVGWLAARFDLADLLETPSSEIGLQLTLPATEPVEQGVLLAPPGADGPPSDVALRIDREFSTGDAAWTATIWTTRTAGVSPLSVMVVVLGLLGGALVGLTLLARQRAVRMQTALSQSQHERRTDELTGVPNRAGLTKALHDAVEPGRGDGLRTAVLFCDVDRFKVINDSLGHHVGDELLTVVASRLKACVRPGDVVGRFGGDEFVVICAGVGGTSEAEGVARRITESVAAPMRVADVDVDVEVSVGIALADPKDATDGETLLRNADAAMYSAKRERIGVRTFDSALRKQAVERLSIERALRASLRSSAVRVEYQPIVAASGHDVLGVEALARFDDPLLRGCGPARFVPVAEEIGLVGALGEAVLETACAQLAEWNLARPDARPLALGVNVSDTELRDPGFPRLVSRIVHAHGIAPSQLVLEVSESTVMAHPEHVRRAFASLTEMGVEVSIDDFGTGQVSLLEIARFDLVSEIKLDRSLVSGPSASSVRGLFVSAIAEIAGGLRARMVAEGVETHEQLESVVAAGVQRVQGFLFHEPAPPEALTDVVLRSDAALPPRTGQVPDGHRGRRASDRP